MIESLLYILNPAHFEAHGIHFIQTPVLFWVFIGANLLIFLSYVLIPLALLYLVRKRKDIMFTPIFFLFAAFIVLCGIHHLIHVITFWYPIYALEAIEDMLTGFVSIGTFFALLYVLPLALKLKSPKELEEINTKLFMEIKSHKQAEEELSQKNDELVKMNKLMVDRELKMVELKTEIEALRQAQDKS